MSVVTRAMSTIIVNIFGEITPKSRPMLSTMSSIKPRVFMSMPTAAASRVLIPVKRATEKLPPNLPKQATAISAKQSIQSLKPATSPSCVRRPLNAKNRGKKPTTTKSSRRSAKASA